MSRLAYISALAVAAAGLAIAQEQPPPADQQPQQPEETVVFRSDVALVRVDAQVLDRGNRAIGGLTAEDFVLRENGQVQEIRNFAREDMPVDVLLLLDVSGSMRPHVERIADAAAESLRALGNGDRVAIMVFDRSTRVRSQFRSDLNEVARQLQGVIRLENFDGGTDVTRALYDAAAYVGREGRRDARRAIVILTDDQTERDRDENGVARVLDNHGIVLSFLEAPDALQGGYGRGGGYPRGGGGGTYPGRYPGGGGVGGGLGGIIFGRRSPFPGGGGYPGGGGGGPVIIGARTQSAGTREIARRTGGDTIAVDEASALETTLSRIRQRYALHFYLPESGTGQEPRITVALNGTAARRYPDAEVRYRRVNMSGGTDPRRGTYEEARTTEPDPVVVSRAPSSTEDTQPDDGLQQRPRRRRGVSDGSGASRGPAVGSEPGWPRAEGSAEPAPATASASPSPSSASSPGGWKRAEPAVAPAPASVPAAKDPTDNSARGGWRKAKPGEQEQP